MPKTFFSCAEEIRYLSGRRVQIFEDDSDDWPFATSLKAFSEDTAQEYEGRALLELIQNGHDAIPRGSMGRVRVVLDDTSDAAALYVANDGRPFSSKNFHAIVEFGRSDKAAAEGIGNKGLGFRSVLMLTDHPEVYSRDPHNADDQQFSGYSFRFPNDEEFASLAGNALLGRRLIDEASALDFPVPAVVEDPEVLRFAADGFATVVKLPLRDGAAVEDARRQIQNLASAEAPLLLFLERVTNIEVLIYSGDIDAAAVHLTRSQATTKLAGENGVLHEVDLGAQGRYLVARRSTAEADFKLALQNSAATRKVDQRWLEWKGDASVGVALRLDQDLAKGITYTFLPTRQHSPLAAHVHAPFFIKLARGEVSLDVPLNDYLMGEIAATCLDLLRRLRDEGDHGTVARHVVDLVAWQTPEHRFLERACVEQGAELRDELCVPVAGQPEWASLNNAFAWPKRIRECSLSVISPTAVSAVANAVIDPEIGTDRQDRLAALRAAIMSTGMEPTDGTMAEWVEAIAASLNSESVTFEVWSNFYDDLAAIFHQFSSTELQGCRIVLDQNGDLQCAMGAEKADTTTPVIFFADDDDAAAAGAAKLPKALARRIVYMHPDIPWTVTDPSGHRRPGRAFLQSEELVRESSTGQLLQLLRELMTSRPSRAIQSAALDYGCTLHPNLTEKQRNFLAKIPFTVPTAQGQWSSGRSVAFSRAWGTRGGDLLNRLLGFATDETPGLSSITNLVIADPKDWPVAIDDQTRWEAFLRTIGIHDGLPLVSVQIPADVGSRLRYTALEAVELHPKVRKLWEQDINAVWAGGTHRNTRYQFATAVTALPGAGEAESLGTEAREIYAELIGLGLSAWPENVFEVEVLRPERRATLRDVHHWPTPLKSYLCLAQWIPIDDNDDESSRRSFVGPAHTWLSPGGQLPGFVPAVTQRVRRRVNSTPALDRMRKLGIGIWGDAWYCGAVVRDLPDLLNKGRVAPHHVAAFKKQYRKAWVDLLEHRNRWPWSVNQVPVVVTTQGPQMQSLRVQRGITILIPDETDHTKLTLLGLTAQHVLIAEPTRGQELTSLMRNHGIDVVPTSEVSVEVYGDDQLVVADPALPALFGNQRQWISTVIALVVELKSGPFDRPTEQTIRQILERLRMVRLVKANSVRLVLGGEDIEPPAHTTSLAIDNDIAPTIVTWASDATVFEELEQCSRSVAELIRHTQLGDALQLAFSRLGQVCPAESPILGDNVLAHALQVSEEQIRESRAGLRGPLGDVLDRIRILVVYFGGPDELDKFEVAVRHVADDEAAITAVLDTMQSLLPLPASDLVNACRLHTQLASLRDELELDFVRFNDALTGMEPPHPPLQHPDRHEEAFTRFVDDHKEAILARLREAYIGRAQAREDLAAYGEARNNEGLVPDPEWLAKYAEPPKSLLAEHVGLWLSKHEASPDLDRLSNLPDAGNLRRANFEQLDKVVRNADLRVRAWCRRQKHGVPSGWDSPTTEARSALESSYLSDFFELSVDDMLNVVADRLGWPADMPRTLDLAQLGLDEKELLSKEQADTAERQRRQHQRTHVHLDGREVSVDVEDLPKLADTVAAGVTEDLLAQSGRVELQRITARSNARRGPRGLPGVTVARDRGMSEAQRNGVGLAGEIVARAWLERHYTDVEWVSGYRNIVLSDDGGSDSHGYDFQARGRSRGRFYFEVKAMVGEVDVGAEFELGETEVLAAQRYRNSYRIILVSSALDSELRQILELPNPLASTGVGRYTVLGRGLRYRCMFDG